MPIVWTGVFPRAGSAVDETVGARTIRIELGVIDEAYSISQTHLCLSHRADAGRGDPGNQRSLGSGRPASDVFEFVEQTPDSEHDR